MRDGNTIDYRFLLLIPALLFAPACGDDKDSSGTPESGTSGNATSETGAPTTDAPDTDAPTTDAPTTDAPTTDAPTTDEPTTDAPVDDTGSTGESDNAPFCRYRCEATPDCFIGGVDNQTICNDDGNCVSLCETAPDCIPAASGWTDTPCISNADCGGGFCIDHGDSMGCGFGPADGATCADQGQSDVEVTDAEGNTVTACGNTDDICEDGNCAFAPRDCRVDGCPAPLTCEADGSCSCDSDEACVESGFGDACRDEGFCVPECDPDADMPCGGGELPFDGGALVCEV